MTISPQRFVESLRDPTFTPPDPDGASLSRLADVRAALHRFHPQLNVWWYPTKRPWDPLPGRWVIVEWLKRNCVWSEVYVWETADKRFRDIGHDAIDHILNRLKAAEMDGPEAARKVQEWNDERERRHSEEKAETRRKAADEFVAFHRRGRQHIGMGKGSTPRSRKFINGCDGDPELVKQNARWAAGEGK